MGHKLISYIKIQEYIKSELFGLHLTHKY